MLIGVNHENYKKKSISVCRNKFIYKAFFFKQTIWQIQNAI
jgi:hypothetical protein